MTKSKSPYQFNFAVAPGRYIKEYMEYYGYSYEKFAELCNCSVKSVKEIVIEQKPLTIKMAKKIERELDFPADMLMRIEKKYRIFQNPVIKVKTREEKTPMVQQSYAVAQ